ncbi:hypothetical protein FSPOR_5699 [Fusarium sporotrichioides]|uniref:Uncharacterized protein n=1 Tax=Fusarium sporotrichioides TaxID=5514 RepID=A0A395S639_FUSSP|nr:hypothetical protein FSPOR_5699 [Fusarium sporotrichioides]
MAVAAVQEHFGNFLHDAKSRSEKTMQSWDKEKTSLVSILDNFYEHECLKVHPDHLETLKVLTRFHAKAKDCVEAIFNTCSASQRKDADDFGIGLMQLASSVKQTRDDELQRLEIEARTSKDTLEQFQAMVETREADSRRSIEATRNWKQREDSSPVSAGLGFERAHYDGKKKDPFTTSKAKRRERILKAAVSPVSRNAPARSPMRSPTRGIPRSRPARTPSPPKISPTVRDPSTPRKSRASESMQSHDEVFESERLENIHPMMGESIRAASELNQEYEDSLVVINDDELPGWENGNDDDEEHWQGKFHTLCSEPEAKKTLADEEDPAQRHALNELSARNSRLVEQNSDLSTANEDLREENDKFQEMIGVLTNSNNELKRENEELRTRPGYQGLPVDDTYQAGVGVLDSLNPDLEITDLAIPDSPAEPEQHEKPASPVSPGPSDTVSSQASIRGTANKSTTAPTKASEPVPGSLHRFGTSDMASPDDVSPYPDSMSSMSGIVECLRQAVVRCNNDIQRCQKDMKTSLGRETSSKFLLECWENATKKHRHDFQQTIKYFQATKSKPPPSRDDFHAGSSSLGGSPRSAGSPRWASQQKYQPQRKGWNHVASSRMSDTSDETQFTRFGGSPPSSSMVSSFDSDFVGGSRWDPPAHVSPKSGSTPGLAGSKEKPHEPERVQESSPVEGSSDKKSSTQEGGPSTSGDGLKKNQSEPEPQPRPQNSQESSGLRTDTRGTESSDSDNVKHKKKRKRVSFMDLILSFNPLLVAIVFYHGLLVSQIDSWIDRWVRRPWRRYNIAIAIPIILTTVFLCLYTNTYSIYLVVQRERNMWREANNMAKSLMLKRTAMPSTVSLWGLSEEQGLVKQGVGDFVEFMCWSLGITALKNSAGVWMLNQWAVVCGFFSFVFSHGKVASEGWYK